MLELVSLPQQRKFGQDKRDTLTQFCRDCDVRFACNGGCPKDRFATSPYGEPGQHHLCPGYQDFFHHVQEPMQAMTQRRSRGRRARGPSAAAEPRPVRGDGFLRPRRRRPRAQRALHVRVRKEVEGVPRIGGQRKPGDRVTVTAGRWHEDAR